LTGENHGIQHHSAALCVCAILDIICKIFYFVNYFSTASNDKN